MALFGRAQIMGGRQTTSATPPSPPYTTNLFAWWDAARTASISHSSGLVDSWADQIAGRLLNGVTTTRPTTNATTRAGWNVIDFASDYLTDAGTKADIAFMHNGASSTVYMVCTVGSASPDDTDYGLWGNNAGGSSNIGHYVQFNGAGAAIDKIGHVVTRGVGGSFVVSNFSGNNYLPSQTWVLIEVFCDADAGGGASARSGVYVAAGAAVANNISTGADSNSDPTYAWQVGALGNNAGPGVLSVAEILVYSEGVTGTSRTDTRDYLGDKWSVAV